MRFQCSLWLSVPLLLAAQTSFAQALVTASPDVTIPLGALVATDETAAIDNQLGIVVAEDLGPLPDPTDVIAYDVDVNGDRLIALDVTTSLAGNVVARPGDVVRYDGASYSIEFDAQAAGLPAGVRTDAVSVSPRGLILSFDTHANVGGVIAADEDLVEWDGAGFTLAFDGSAVGLDTRLDTDAAQALGSGAYLLSFDVSGSIDGLTFDDEDVLQFDGTGFTMAFDGSNADPDWAGADLDAVRVPEPAFVGPMLLGAFALGAIGRSRRQRAALAP